MTRCEENKMVVNVIAKALEKSSDKHAEVVTLKLGVIATALCDISKSLAILADKAEGTAL